MLEERSLIERRCSRAVPDKRFFFFFIFFCFFFNYIFNFFFFFFLKT